MSRAAQLAGIAIERRLAEEALRGSEAKFRGLFESIAEGVYQSGRGGRLLSVNPAFVSMLGYGSAAELYALPSAGAAHRYLAAYEAATAGACFQLVLTDAVGASASVALVPLTSQVAGLGDESAGYEGTVQGTNGAGQTVALVADIVAARVGRAVKSSAP